MRVLPKTVSAGVVLAMTCALVLTPTHAGALRGSFFPTVNEGNRGQDVRTVQYLLHTRGYDLKPKGKFGEKTKAAVKSFQRKKGLTPHGIVGPSTWIALIRHIEDGDRGYGVRAVQSQLNAKRDANLTVNGVYGKRTKGAVRAFQRHVGIAADGVVDRDTWRNLLWHYQRAKTGSGLCSHGSTSRQWGTAATVRQLKAAASGFRKTKNGGLSLGDIGLEHGGPLAPHVSHQVGMDADIRPIRKDSRQCDYGTEWRSSSYDRMATRQLVWKIYANSPKHVMVIWFNDPVLIDEGLTEHLEGHDGHLHVRWCTASHPNDYYVCGRRSSGQLLD